MAGSKEWLMRIDLVIGSLQPGGAEKQLCGLAERLHSRGADVNVVTLFDNGPLATRLTSIGVPLTSLASRPRDQVRSHRGLRASVVGKRLTEHWLRRRPAAIQAWLPEAQIIALPVARLVGIPCRVMAVRSMANGVSLSRGARVGLRVAATCATDIVANSDAVSRDPAWPIRDTPRYVIRNGLHIPPASALPEVQPPHAVVVANLTPIKGHDVLLQALERLTDPPSIQLVGRGPLEFQIASKIRALSLSDRVTLVGGVNDVTPYLLRSQFAILPSPSEGLPNALMEAMAVGLPVVAFGVGGIPEIVEDGVTGILVEPGDVSGLASAIERIADDPEWRSRAGALARERMTDFSWESVVELNLEMMANSTSLREGSDK